MGTNVQYGNVTLYNVLTREFRQDFVKDQHSTTVIAVRTRATFEAVLHRAGSAGDTSLGVRVLAGLPTSVPTEYARLTAALREPRQNLTITMEERNVVAGIPPTYQNVTQTFFRCTPANSGLPTDDIENGPFPVDLTVKHIAGGETIRVLFTVQCTQTICSQAEGESPSGPPPVISNRWGVDEAMDQDFYVTRTIRGFMRFTHSDTPNHVWKPLVMPPLENGFKRISMDFGLSEDNLSAVWSVVDRQVQNSAPWPASSIQGRHTESCADGVTFTAEMDITLTAPVGTSRAALIATAAKCIEARIRWVDGAKDNTVLVLSSSITVMFGDKNEVHARGVVMRKPGGSSLDNLTFLPNVIQNLALGLDNNVGSTAVTANGSTYYEGMNRTPPDYGFAHGDAVRSPNGLFLSLHCVRLPVTACEGVAAMGVGVSEPAAIPPEPPGKGSERTGDETVVSGDFVAQIDDTVSLFAASTEPAMYTLYKAEAKYRLKKGNLQIPLSGGDGDTDDEDTCVVIQTRRPQALRVFNVEAERAGMWPALPEPDETYDESGTCKATLLHHDVTLLSPHPGADGGTLIYTAMGLYVYALSRPLKPEEKFTTPPLPFTSLGEDDYKIEGDVLYSLSAPSAAPTPPPPSTEPAG